jgi:peptidyl-tRNA hydrolase
MEKLYVVVRRDLSSGAMLAQACHAVAEYALLDPQSFNQWASTTRNIVVLQTNDEQSLKQTSQRARTVTPVAEFREPDLEDSLTAIAFDSQAWRQVSSLSLALRHEIT